MYSVPLAMGTDAVAVEMTELSARSSTLNWRRSVMYVVLLLETYKRNLMGLVMLI